VTQPPIDQSSSAGVVESDEDLPADIDAWLRSVGRRLWGEAYGSVLHSRWEQALLDPARSFLLRVGKGFRASLTEHGWQLAGGAEPCPTELRLVVELLHAGSLIVDDVEDGGEQRRGEPALHELHGVPVALNIGNWLYFAPLELLQRLQLPATRELALHRAVAGTLTRGHQGQALDLGLRVCELSRHEVADVVSTATRLKTGALMELAATLGPIAAGAPEHVRGALGSLGGRFGAALQMLNDLRGLTEPAAEDLHQGRATWPWAWLAETLDDVSFRRMQRRARNAMRDERESERLAGQLLRETEERGHAAIHAELTRALTELRAAFPRQDLSAIEAEVARLEDTHA